MSTQDESSKNTGQTSLFSETSAISEALPPSTSLLEDSLARIFHWQERARVSTETEAVFGGKCTESLATYDPDTQSWRTSQHSLIEDFQPFSEPFPKSGMMRNGRLYPRRRLVPRTLENVSSLWPTASSRDWKDTPGMSRTGTNPDGSERDRTDQLPRAVYAQMWATPKSSPSGPDYARVNRKGSGGDDLVTQVARITMWATPMAHPRTHTPRQVDHGIQLANQIENAERLWPTPRARMTGDSTPERMKDKERNLEKAIASEEQYGSINPDWVCILMGFPIGWENIDG